MASLRLSVLLLVATTALGHGDDWEAPVGRHAARRHPAPTPTLERRQGPAYPTGPGYDFPTPIASIVPLPANYTQNTLAVMSTYAGGVAASLSGAPALPEPTLIAANYPPTEKIPPTDSPQVKAWMDAIDWSTIPNYSPTADRTNCQNATNAEALAQAGADGRCWWTCGQCTRDVDITTCANSMQYGHGYDDGPGLYTPKLLTYLESKALHATFYLIGSRVLYRPEMVRYEYMTGHELSVHTWSHGGDDLLGLTQMTNEQIVAELGWTRQIIKDVTGVSPTTMRPPFGDIDDRVRAISLAMGMVPIIWTTKLGENGAENVEWDSGDWRVHGGNVAAEENQQAFERVLDSSTQFTDHGVIALQHDNSVETVDLAIGYTLPFLLAHQPAFDIQPVMQCQGRPIADMYNETLTNPDGPWFGHGDIATRTSNVGFDEVSAGGSVPASRTYVSTGTRTATSTSRTGAAARRVGVAGGWVVLVVLAVVAAAL